MFDIRFSNITYVNINKSLELLKAAAEIQLDFFVCYLWQLSVC